MQISLRGTRLLSQLTIDANLAMGAHSITTVGTVDGRDVAADGGVLDAHGAANHTDRIRSIFFQPSTFVTGATWDFIAPYACVLLNADAEIAYGTIQIPGDYVSGIVVYAVVIPATTGNMIVDIYSAWGQPGEAYNTNLDVHGDETQGVSQNYIEKVNLNIDFAAPDSGATPAAGEILTVHFEQDTGVALNLLGFIIEYTADM